MSLLLSLLGYLAGAVVLAFLLLWGLIMGISVIRAKQLDNDDWRHS